MKTSIRLAVIYGSTRKGRICDRVVKWLTQELVRFPQFDIDIIDPLDFALPPDRDMAHPEIDRLAGRLGMADAFIIVTPEYNHSFSAALKSTIDLFFEPWQGKPVALFPMAASPVACARSSNYGSSLRNSMPSPSAIRSAFPRHGAASTSPDGLTIRATLCTRSTG